MLESYNSMLGWPCLFRKNYIASRPAVATSTKNPVIATTMKPRSTMSIENCPGAHVYPVGDHSIFCASQSAGWLSLERPDDRQCPCDGANVLSIVSSRDVDIKKELKLAADFLLKPRGSRSFRYTERDADINSR
jgi:hypothetical protein